MDAIESASTENTIAEKPFKKIPSVLLDSLVEEPKRRRAVPHHLLESSTFVLSDCSPTLERSLEELLYYFSQLTGKALTPLFNLCLPVSPNLGRRSQERNNGGTG